MSPSSRPTDTTDNDPYRRPVLSPTVENYLKTIYLVKSEEPVSTTTIALARNVTLASATGMIKRLAEMKLVDYQSYKGARLTDLGEKVALEIIRHHRLLETYFKDILGYPWDKIHEEAEELEHHISELFEEKLDAMLGQPTRDPHGHPIPTRNLSLIHEQTVPLAYADSGVVLQVDHLSDEDSDLLVYLEESGILPSTKVEILDKMPFQGPLTILVDKVKRIIGYHVAQNIFVADPDGIGQIAK